MSEGSPAERTAGGSGVAPRVLTFTARDLAMVRRVTAQWADAADLPPARANDLVLAVNEIAANAVRHGSPVARLVLLAEAGDAVADVRDHGTWRPGIVAAPGAAGRGGMGLLLARLVCDEVEITPSQEGTRVLLRMRRDGPRVADGA